MFNYDENKVVFENASIIANPGNCIVGPSGEDKTTMVRVLLALIKIKRKGSYQGCKQYGVQYFSRQQKILYLCTSGKYHIFWNYNEQHAHGKEDTH